MTRRLQILLHVGPHKTGSTTLQRNLHRHRAALAAQGIHYLGPDGAYRHLYSAFMTDPGRNYRNRNSGLTAAQIAARDAQVRDALFARLAQLEGSAILSSEFLCKMTPAEFARIRAALSAHGDVHCVYFYRELLPWMASNSAQMAKVGRIFQPTGFAPALARLDRIPRSIAQVFGPGHSHFLKFEDAIGQGLCNSLLAAFGLPGFTRLGLCETHENEALSDQAVRAMYLYNLRHPIGSGRRDPQEIARLCALPGAKYRLDGLRPHEIRAYAQGRNALARDLGFRLAPPETLPVAARPDALNARQIAPYLPLRARAMAALQALRRF